MTIRFSRTVAALVCSLPLIASAAAPVLEVFKSPTCGCCKEWVKHLQANGLTVNVHEVDDPSAVRASRGMPDAYGSCHTATVQGYTIEGHVPAADIKRLLATKPAAVQGLAVPGMPMGSPGMEGPRHDAFDVLAVDKAGRATLYKHYD